MTTGHPVSTENNYSPVNRVSIQERDFLGHNNLLIHLNWKNVGHRITLL
jgi:hypothetical protein